MPPPPPPPRVDEDEEERRKAVAGRQYGLNVTAEAAALGSGASEETRERLARALREAEEAERLEREKRAALHAQKRGYRAGAVNEEERARRLAEMMGDAAHHDDAQRVRFQAVEDRRDSGAEEALQRGGHDPEAFRNRVSQSLVAGQSAADRIGSRSHYRDNSNSDVGAFKRR